MTRLLQLLQTSSAGWNPSTITRHGGSPTSSSEGAENFQRQLTKHPVSKMFSQVATELSPEVQIFYAPSASPCGKSNGLSSGFQLDSNIRAIHTFQWIDTGLILLYEVHEYG